MALTGTSTNQLQVKLKDVVGRLTEAENRQMLRGPKGSKGELGIKGQQVKIVYSGMSIFLLREFGLTFENSNLATSVRKVVAFKSTLIK